MAKLSIKDLDLKGQARFRPRRFQRADQGRRDRRRHADPRLAADDSVRARRTARPSSSRAISGRPKGKPNPQFSLRPVADRLAELLGRPVVFAEDCIGDEAKRAIDRAQRSGGGSCCSRICGSIRKKRRTTRSSPRRSRRSPICTSTTRSARRIARMRRSKGSRTICGRAAAGLLMEQELRYLGHVLESPERPFVAILGGAKVSDKIEVIENLLGKVDRLLIGGAMAYTFFKSRGVPIGRSLVEDDKLDAARTIEADATARGVRLELPVDHVVTDRDRSRGRARGAGGRRSRRSAIGSASTSARRRSRRTQTLIADAKTVVWNGPMGVFEIDAFAAGTNAVARAVAAVKGTTIIGGGDSIAAVKKAGVADRITHISTGGGASLEFLGGRTLPGVAALTDK